MNVALTAPHGPFPAAINRAISLAAGGCRSQAEAAMAATGQAMRNLLDGLGDLATWRLSTLTGDGFPCELTFTTANDALRLTCETGAPRAAGSKRLGEVARLAAMLSSPGVGAGSDPGVDADLALLERLQSWQALGPLEFGAWLGLRVTTAGRVGTKVYAEMPAAAQPAALRDLASCFGVEPGLPGREKSLRMIGFTPGHSRLEYYFAVHGLQSWEIGALMHPLGLHGRRAEVLPVFESVLGRALHHALPSPVFGFSYAVGGDELPVFSFYAFADHLFRSDASARARLLEFLQRHDLQLNGYEAVSEPVRQDATTAHGHGLFGVALAGDLPPVIHVGLRPPLTRAPDAGQGQSDKMQQPGGAGYA
ncbi:hypothetical protein [Maricaulis sp.]|uniref:hypothetical protein n=1 Tax=Maricaulis sp. TaxID=1486257 RepID=UPI00260CF9F8|nr:hypothetical protein [Maricaulis sp.]